MEKKAWLLTLVEISRAHFRGRHESNPAYISTDEEEISLEDHLGGETTRDRVQMEKQQIPSGNLLHKH